jgi:hypothetical protein
MVRNDAMAAGRYLNTIGTIARLDAGFSKPSYYVRWDLDGGDNYYSYQSDLETVAENELSTDDLKRKVSDLELQVEELETRIENDYVARSEVDSEYVHENNLAEWASENGYVADDELHEWASNNGYVSEDDYIHCDSVEDYAKENLDMYSEDHVAEIVATYQAEGIEAVYNGTSASRNLVAAIAHAIASHSAQVSKVTAFDSFASVPTTPKPISVRVENAPTAQLASATVAPSFLGGGVSLASLRGSNVVGVKVRVINGRAHYGINGDQNRVGAVGIIRGKYYAHDPYHHGCPLYAVEFPDLADADRHNCGGLVPGGAGNWISEANLRTW